MGENEDEHIDAHMLVSDPQTSEATWPCPYKALGTRKPRPMIWCASGVEQSRDSKELTQEGRDEFSHAGNGTCSSGHRGIPPVVMPEFKVWPFGLREEFYVLADQQALVELRQKERLEILIGSPPCGDFSSLSQLPASIGRWRRKTC